MRLRLGAAALALAHITCQGVPLLAPPGSTLTLYANPTFIPAHGGVSRIVAVVTEPAGTPVADGTVVMFLTNLGRIDERARTTDGIAQVNLVADARSGVATVVAFSGGPAAAPPSTTTPSTTLTAASAAFASSGAAFSGAANTDEIDVTIGNANVDFIQLRAEPARIGNSRTTTVTATVYDENGNPMANVPVFFRVAGDDGTETFDNPGPVFTNNNGEASSTLRTRRDFAGGTVTVFAEAPGAGDLVKSPDLVIPVF